MLTVKENRYACQRQTRHAHAETTVTVVLAGQLRERVGLREEIARPLSIVVKPRDTEHANEFGSGVRTLQLILSDSAAAKLEDADGSFRRWRWHHGGPAVPTFLHLLRLVRAGADQNYAPRVEEAAFEALAALTVEAADSARGSPPGWLVEIKQALDDSTLPPSVKQLATSAHVHPVYLARQFRRWFGHSIRQHIVRQRAQRAAALIVGSSAPLAWVAYTSGFADQAHMCRIISRETGLTPNSYRTLVGA